MRMHPGASTLPAWPGPPPAGAPPQTIQAVEPAKLPTVAATETAASDSERMSKEEEEALSVVDFSKESQRDGGAKGVAELLRRLTNVADVGGGVSVLEGTAWDESDSEEDEGSDAEDEGSDSSSDSGLVD